jgi:hypothetical protein
MRSTKTCKANFASGCNRLEFGENSKWEKKSGWEGDPVLSRHLPEAWKYWVFNFLCDQLGIFGWTMDGRKDTDI